MFELFPLDFVNEVRRKMGSASFFSSTPLGWQFHTVLRKFCLKGEEYAGELEVLASLLPFGWGAQNISHDLDLNSHMIEHDSLRTWMIEESGIVRVGIVSLSIGQLDGNDIHCLIAVPSEKSEWKKVEIQNNINLSKWLKCRIMRSALFILRFHPVALFLKKSGTAFLLK